jgi:hypothetical protein
VKLTLTLASAIKSAASLSLTEDRVLEHVPLASATPRALAVTLGPYEVKTILLELEPPSDGR